MRTRLTLSSGEPANWPVATLLLILVLLAMAVGVGACNGGDDDDGSSPTPSPTTFTPIGCQIVWVTHDPPGQSNIIDYYLVDAPVGNWTTGSADVFFFLGDTTGATNVTGAFVDDFDLVTRTEQNAALCTSGSFAKTVSSVEPLKIGNPVSFTDAAAQEYFLVDINNDLSTSMGNSGTGSFTGVWSSPFSPNVTPGSGTVAVLFQGTNLVMGSDFTYAQCYEAGSSFAKMTMQQRIREAGVRAGTVSH